ncbi:c-type cytochrome [Roseovarius faecimaris]|uniref:C-type cytochrome n=1 Tax=Roseovarius faecimaris TaxID=2494550 RepID=A0A6I6IPR8_9RHOB|nr:c-type cytochrome [Roseovarius faecimaris]QGX97813.1 c-type cytochrome [Roseovarius faecimaris]
MRLWSGVGILALVACAQTVSDTSLERGREIFASYCASCHGSSGTGDGILATDLPVRPADLTMLSKRNGGVFPTSDVMAKIYGYPGRYQAEVMPEFGPVLEGPSVRWTDEAGLQVDTPQALLDLATYLQSLQDT